MFLNLLRAAKGALIRAAASTLPLSRFAFENPPKGEGARLDGLSIRRRHRARQDDGLGLKWVTWSRALPGVEWSARYTRARDNKSLDASGVSGLVIDNLSVTRLSPAASTQSFARIAF